MMAFSASVVQVSAAVVVLAILFATATTAGANNGTVATNTAAMVARRGDGNSTTALPGRQRRTNKYTCYLCHKRKSLMIKRFSIAKDGCHVACVTLPTPSARSPPPPVTALGVSGSGSGRDADDCYVMKVYPDGSWVVVDVVSCRQAAPACYLTVTCNDGDEPGRDDGPPGPPRQCREARCRPSWPISSGAATIPQHRVPPSQPFKH